MYAVLLMFTRTEFAATPGQVFLDCPVAEVSSPQHAMVLTQDYILQIEEAKASGIILNCTVDPIVSFFSEN